MIGIDFHFDPVDLTILHRISFASKLGSNIQVNQVVDWW